MSTSVPSIENESEPSPTDALQELVIGLETNSDYQFEVADQINDDYVSATLTEIAEERKHICEEIGDQLVLRKKADCCGQFIQKLGSIGRSLRDELAGSEPTSVLVEAKRAEDMIVKKFREVVYQAANSGVGREIRRHFKKFEQGRIRVEALRNGYQDFL